MKRVFNILGGGFFWMVFVIPLAPVSSAESRGTSVLTSLNLVPGAKEAAMGQTGINESEGAEAVYWNPANIGENDRPQIFLSHALFIEDTAQSFAAFARPLRGGKGLGLGISYFNAGTIPQIDDVGQSVGDFSPRDMVATAGFSFPWSHWRWGVTGKYIHSKIIHSASVFSADAGLAYQTPSKRFRWAVVGQNMMGRLKYVEEENPLPRLIRIGFSGLLAPRLRLSMEESFPRSDSPFLSAGTDFFVGRLGEMKSFLRAGYSQGMSRNKDEFSGLTLGTGLKLKSVDLDYAWTLFGELGQTHLFSMNFRMK